MNKELYDENKDTLVNMIKDLQRENEKLKNDNETLKFNLDYNMEVHKRKLNQLEKLKNDYKLLVKEFQFEYLDKESFKSDVRHKVIKRDFVGLARFLELERR